MSRILPLALLITTLSLSTPALALELITSIKPLQLLVAAISDGVSQPQLLIPGANSPHSFQLRPSERRRLEQAELIFWIGPELEMSLTKVLQQLPASTRVVTLLTDRKAESADAHAGDEHDLDETTDDHSDKEAEHDHHGRDSHIWLDPDYAAELALHIAKALSEADPEQKVRYQYNLQQFLVQLRIENQQLQAMLEPVKQHGYFVFHDAYRGFEQHFNLNHLGAFTLSPERRPGARHLAEIRQQLIDRQAVCVFNEPQFPAALVNNLIEGSRVRQGQLDPMGVGIDADANGYFNLLRQLGRQFSRCLSAPK